MNERIKQLEKQASDYYWSLDDGVRTADAFTQKFAELIVEECAAHLHRRGVEGFGILEERNLKEHFGVES